MSRRPGPDAPGAGPHDASGPGASAGPEAAEAGPHDAAGADAPDAAPSDARVAAYRVLRDVAEGELADRSGQRRFSRLSGRDRGLAMEMAFGCLRLRGRLDHELAALVDRPLERTEPGVLDWLRLGLYQLRETRTPPHAAVHETVEGVRATVGRRAVGFVNGVLRAALRSDDREALFPSLEEDPVGHLATWGSHPEWIVRRWLARWPLEAVARLVELDNRPPDVVLRLLGVGREEAARRAREAGRRVEPVEGWPRSVRLAGGDPTELLDRIPSVVQDPGASAVVDYVGPAERGPVVDACAAPGGKAAVLAHGDPGARPFVAADVSAGRLRRVREVAARLEVPLHAVAMDARRPAVEAARLVLVDAPCTGTGTLRRRPDARWRLEPRRLDALAGLQREILDGCAGLVEPGGVLVYATCSLEPEENEEQVQDFLTRHSDFRRDPPASTAELPADTVDGEGDLRVAPWLHGVDGAYAARLRRRER